MTDQEIDEKLALSYRKFGDGLDIPVCVSIDNDAFSWHTWREILRLNFKRTLDGKSPLEIKFNHDDCSPGIGNCLRGYAQCPQ